jgi:hypothetical protein
MAAGLFLLSVPVIRAGLGKPQTALILLVVLNLSYWLSYQFRLLRPSLLGTATPSGEGLFLGPLAIWGILLAAVGLYQFVAFLRGLIIGEQRAICVLGLTGLAFQVLVTLKSIWLVVGGVVRGFW